MVDLVGETHTDADRTQCMGDVEYFVHYPISQVIRVQPLQPVNINNSVSCTNLAKTRIRSTTESQTKDPFHDITS